MWKHFADGNGIEYRRNGIVVHRCLNFLLFDFLADKFRHFGIDFMAGISGNNLSLYLSAGERQVTDYVQQFVTGRFIVEFQITADDTQFTDVEVRLVHHISQFIKLFLRHLTVVNHYCIFQITAFNQILVQQLFYFPYKDKRSCSRYFACKFIHRFNRGKLIGEYGRIETDMHIDTEIIIR